METMEIARQSNINLPIKHQTSFCYIKRKRVWGEGSENDTNEIHIIKTFKDLNKKLK